MDVEAGGFAEEVASLLEAERLARQANDMALSLSTATQLFELLRRRGDPAALVATVAAVCNKRGQFQRTVVELVRLAMAAGAAIADTRAKVAFFEGVKALCEKKIYLEVEHARCAMILVKYGETQDLAAASRVIEGVQVETYGSMDRREKLEFILYQMKLHLLLGETLKLYIVSRKVSAKALDAPDVADLRLMFHLFMFHHAFAGKDFAGCAAALRGAHAALAQADAAQLQALDAVVRERFAPLLERRVLAESFLLFSCLEGFSAGKAAALRALRGEFEAHLLDNAPLARVVDAFLSPEITSCRLEDYPTARLYLLASPYEAQGALLAALRFELVQKNCHVVSLHFSNARLDRLAQLLRADADLIEEVLCRMVFEDLLRAKIDRPARVVDFRTGNAERAALADWIANVNQVLDLTDFVAERIQREEVKVRAE